MIHHKGYVLLGKRIERSSLGDDAPDKSMVVLNSPLLVVSLWIAVKYTHSLITLQIGQ